MKNGRSLGQLQGLLGMGLLSLFGIAARIKAMPAKERVFPTINVKSAVEGAVVADPSFIAQPQKQ